MRNRFEISPDCWKIRVTASKYSARSRKQFSQKQENGYSRLSFFSSFFLSNNMNSEKRIVSRKIWYVRPPDFRLKMTRIKIIWLFLDVSENVPRRGGEMKIDTGIILCRSDWQTGINFISTVRLRATCPKCPRGKVRIGKTVLEPGYLLLRYFWWTRERDGFADIWLFPRPRNIVAGIYSGAYQFQ